MATESVNLCARIEPTAKPVNVAESSEVELNAELEKGYADALEGRTKPASRAFADIRKDYNL